MAEQAPNAATKRMIPLSRAAASISMRVGELKRELLDSKAGEPGGCLYLVGRRWRVDVEAFAAWLAARQVIAAHGAGAVDRASIRLTPRLVRRRAGASRG